MPRNFRWMVLFVAALLMSGCATDLLGKKGGAMMAARYGDLEKHAQEEVTDMATSKTVKLFPLCVAFAKQKNTTRRSRVLARSKSISAKATPTWRTSKKWSGTVHS